MTTPQAPQSPEPATTSRPEATRRRPRNGTGARRASSPERESRYRRRPPATATDRGPEANRVLRLVLTEPDTVPMTEHPHQQAISALSAMIVSWLQRRAHHGRPPTG